MGKRGASETEKALATLQRVVRSGSPPAPEEISLSRAVPEDLAREGASWLYLDREERQQFEHTKRVLAEDLRFEHLAKKTDDTVWRFVCQASLEREHDYVPTFVKDHAIEPQQLSCFFPIESLTVDQPRELPGALLLPVDHPDVPPRGAGFDPQAAASLLRVPTEGTHYGRMAERGARVADHALRVLRVALRAHRSVNDQQLRFRRGVGYSFGPGLAGWKLPADVGFDLGLNDELHQLAQAQRVWQLEAHPENNLLRQAALALRWIERGALTVEPLESLLFFFFALEALLGDKAEGRKAHNLAFRRALLSIAVGQAFTDPDRVYGLYDQVRSAAVHGSEPPEVTAEEVRRFGWDVREALDQYLEYGATLGVGRRSKLLRALDEHPEREKLKEALKEFGSPVWQEFEADEDT